MDPPLKLHQAARDLANSLGVVVHMANVEGVWGLYPIAAPPGAVSVRFDPPQTGDGGAAHGRFRR